MKKIQQFYICKISSERIRANNYKLELTYDEAVRNQEIVSLADSQLLRTIRDIKNLNFFQSRVDELLKKKKHLSKNKDSKTNKKELLLTTEEIEKILFVQEIVSVHFSHKRHANKLIEKNGFILNGKKYVPFMASSGMIRRNTMLFVDESYHTEIDKRFQNGRNPDIEMVSVKYGVYYSLFSSSSLEVTFPRIAVVKDKLFKSIRTVDYSKLATDTEEPETYPQKREIETNGFDGQGLVLPRMAKQWASELDIDYIPSAFIVRAPYLKGLCVVFEFDKLAKEHGISKITDIYGNEVELKTIDVIVSESQFKLWSSYSSTQEYINRCFENNLGWGITRVTPKTDKNHAFSSYQFIQSLHIEKPEEICEPTVKWLESLFENKEAMLIYLLGEIDYSEGWFDRLEPWMKSILLENGLLEDAYFLKQIDKSLVKKKKETLIGKLLFQGNYQFMIADPYYQACHVLGIESDPLVLEGNCYSQYWNEKKSNEIALVRSPIVYAGEVNKLKLTDNEKTKKWFKYIYSGIIFPAYGVSLDFAVLGGADSDGDIVFSTNYSPFVNGQVEGLLPIFYNVESPPKGKVNDKKDFLKKQSRGLGTIVGFLTNVGSTIVTMLADYPQDSLEHKILTQRWKYIRTSQGLEIDSQKGIIIPKFPKWWTKAERGADTVRKNVTITKRPYFFRYLYEYMGKKYLEEYSVYENISRTIYNLKLSEIMGLPNKTKDQISLIEEYKKHSSFIDNNSTMNRVCHYMERELKKITKTKRIISSEFDYKKLLSDESYKPTKADIEKLKLLYKEYKSLKKSLRENVKGYGEENYSTLDAIKRYINKRAYATVTSNSEELGNMVIHLCYRVLGESSRKFVWECFGQEVYENIKKRKPEKFIRVPIKNKTGSIKYLYDRYGIYAMNFSIDTNES